MDGSDGIRIDWWRNGDLQFSRSLDFIPRDMAFTRSDPALWVLGADRILRIDPSGEFIERISSGSGEEFMDLFATETGMAVGMRVCEAGTTKGIIELREVSGGITARRTGPETRIREAILATQTG